MWYVAPLSPLQEIFLICFVVVLLDEADVFLEQRSLLNLERNALVSGKPLVSPEGLEFC
jgi:hypothetical protein